MAAVVSTTVLVLAGVWMVGAVAESIWTALLEYGVIAAIVAVLVGGLALAWFFWP